MAGLPPLLIGFALAFLMVAGGGVWMLARSARQDRARARVLQVVAPHLPAVAPPPPPAFRRALDERGAEILGILAKVFGFSVERIATYPIRWWVAILLALPASRVVAGMIASVISEFAVLATPVLWVLLARAYFSWADQQRLDKLYRQFPDALGMVVRVVRVGIPVTEAIRTAANEMPQPTATEFARIADRVAVGMPLEQALAETAARNGLPEYRFFSTALTLQATTGGGLTETLDNLADVIRKRVGLRERANALASEAKTSAGILTALPFFTAGALMVLSPNYIGMLFFDEGGKQILAAALTMLGMGVMVMRSIIRRSLA